jgi:hypothetical protein
MKGYSLFAVIRRILSAARSAAEDYAHTAATITLTAVLGYLSFMGALLLRPAERPAMQVLVVASAAVLLEGHRRLAAPPNDRAGRTNRAVFLLAPAFSVVSISFASVGLYGTFVAGNLTGLETAAWEDYYRDSRAAIVAKTSALRDAAAAHLADVNQKLLDYRNQVFTARLENRPFLESPEQAALASAEKPAAAWQRSLVEFALPPAIPAPDRQKAEAELANCVEAINRLAADAPPPLAIRGVQIGRYTAGSTDPLDRALEALKRREAPALYCMAICGALEIFPLAAVLTLRRRWYLPEMIEGFRQCVVEVHGVLRRSWREDRAAADSEECHAILVVFRPEVHPAVRFNWNCQPPLTQAKFASLYRAILPEVESKLLAAGYGLLFFANADRMPLAHDRPVAPQLNGGVLVAFCERVRPKV